MTYIDPEKLTVEEQQVVARWLEANGCRHYVALEPVIVRGNIAEYVAVCRKDARSGRRMRVVDNDFVILGPKRIRIRRPLSDFLRSDRSTT